MKNLIKCHFNYLLNKNTLIIFLLTIILISFTYIQSALINDYSYTNLELIFEYLSNAQLITKFMMSFIAIFIFANSITSKNDFYAYFLLLDLRRHVYISSKIVLNIIVVFICTFCLFVFFMMFGYIFQRSFFLQIRFLVVFANIFLIAIIFGLYSMLGMQILKNPFTIIISFAVLIISSNINDYEDRFNRVFLFLFPNYLEFKSSLFGPVHLLWLVIVLSIINIWIYQNKDLNY